MCLCIIQYYNILYTQKHKHQNEKTFRVFNRIVQKNQAVRVRKRTVSCFQCSWRVVLTSGKMREITCILNRLMLLTKMFHISACTTHKYPHHYGVLLPMMLTMAITSTFAVEVFTFNQCRIPRIIKLWSFANRSFFFLSQCSNASHCSTFGANQFDIKPQQNQSDEQDLTLHYKHRLMISLALFFIEMTRQKNERKKLLKCTVWQPVDLFD